MDRYVVGFLFDWQHERVVLIQKKKPEWQAGKLNGVGGKIEEPESPLEAMIREFHEEAALRIEDWRIFCTFREKTYTLYCYYAFALDTQIAEVKALTDEPIYLASVSSVLGRYGYRGIQTIHNIPWLIAMALTVGLDHIPPYEIYHP